MKFRHDSRVYFTACLPSVIHCSAVPRLLQNLTTFLDQPVMLVTMNPTRGIDINVTSRDVLGAQLDYCHANPIKRGLVERAEDWRWSSYRFHTLGDVGMLAMDWP